MQSDEHNNKKNALLKAKVVLDYLVYLLAIASIHWRSQLILQQLPNPPSGVTITELTSRKAVLNIQGPLEYIDYYEIVFGPTDSSQRHRVNHQLLTFLFLDQRKKRICSNKKEV